jgi:F0F1-type ATP synthase membrane subunit b/b'
MDTYKELLGNKFRIVEKGLDPEQVNEYLKRGTDSSDSVFKKLEQFTALQEAANTIDEAIKQAKEMAERAKAKAMEEVEHKKAQAVEDGKEITAKIINEARKSVLDYFDNSSSVIMGVMDEALKKAKDQLVSNRAEMREQIEKRVWAEIDRIVKGVDRNKRESLDSKHQSTNIGPTGKAASTVPPSPSDPWQDAR